VNPLSAFIAFIRARRLKKIAEAEEHRRAVIKRQIAERRAGHREFRPLYGELKQSTNRAMAAELGRSWPALSRTSTGG
jgi:hypothetical protein